MRSMATAPSPEPESPPPQRLERRILARAVGVWWVQRLLEAARRRRTSTAAREDDERSAPEPAAR
jgi:hypothetical protein